MGKNTKGACALGCLGCMGVLILAFTLLFSLIGSCVSAANRQITSSDGPADEAPEFKEVWSLGGGDEDAPKIIRIRLAGTIASESRRGSLLGRVSAGDAPGALNRIHSAAADPDVAGILLEIDSPGGEVTMSDILFDALMRFRESETNRFVYALIGDMAASGGYYVAAAANRIMAHPTSWTGSIGVIVPHYNVAELAAKAGVASAPITSGPNKAMLDPLRPDDPAHIAIVKVAVDAAYERFLSVVAEGRGMKVEDIRPYADGRILTAQQALDAKLIDAIGYQEDALDEIRKLAGAEDVRIYRYVEKESFGDLLRDSFIFESADGLADEVKARLDRAATPRAEYLFR